MNALPAIVGPNHQFHATAVAALSATGLLARLVADSLHLYLDSLPAPTSKDWHDAFERFSAISK